MSSQHWHRLILEAFQSGGNVSQQCWFRVEHTTHTLAGTPQTVALFRVLQALFSQLMTCLLTGYNTATTLRTTQEPPMLGKQLESRYLLTRILGFGSSIEPLHSSTQASTRVISNHLSHMTLTHGECITYGCVRCPRSLCRGL